GITYAIIAASTTFGSNIFNVGYTSWCLFRQNLANRKKKPVMIHRSSIGSFERFIGLLLEHFSGNLPLWLAPVQVSVLPIGKNHLKYAKKVFDALAENGIRAELRSENESVGKKIREGEIRKIPYLLIVGDKEMKSKSVAVRKRKKGDVGSVKLEKFIKRLAEEIKKKK
ncbi:MAG: His/Gly/Thr/Pro-type tRNA ligase C-terminal domain-containing protein, partial [Patescibacteria group bacterium]